jgi:hypothetical protein
MSRLDKIASRPGVNDKMTITHVLWVMVGLLPPDQVHRPHRPMIGECRAKTAASRVTFGQPVLSRDNARLNSRGCGR